MKNYFNLPQFQAPGGVDLSPVTNALNAYQKTNYQNALMARQDEEQTYQRGREAKQDARQDEEFRYKFAEATAKRAHAFSLLAPEQQTQKGWDNLIANHRRVFPNDPLEPEDLDYRTGPARYAAAFGGISRDPRDEKMKDLDLQYKQAQIGKLNREAQTSTETAGREQKLIQMGIDPNSAEGLAFIANGKLPQAAVQQMIARQQRQQTAPKISEGLTNLLRMTDQYDDAAFSNAVGPIQGAPPDGGMLTAPFANIARGWGEVLNMAEGGNASPSEVRSNITGSTEALAAAIKPLIRGPGEGVWTDADQARLVSIVGDLAQASDKPEFRRRLNAVRDRIKSNFGLDIEFDALGQTPAQTLQGRGRKPLLDTGDGFKVEFD